MATRTRRISSFVFAMMMSFTDDVYYSWAGTDYKEFHVGDSLVFEYDPNINDVIHVSGALEYELCDYSSPKAVYNTGHDVVALMKPVLVTHDPSRPVPPPQPSNILPVGKTYKVGDSKGWKVYDSDFYNKWSEEKQFRVGDVTVANRAFNQNTDAAIIPAPLSLNFSMSFNLNEQSNARNLAAQCCQASVTEIALSEL
ncbi:unnamed protein product, partial [Brassica rapa subsp. trilocularis]